MMHSSHISRIELQLLIDIQQVSLCNDYQIVMQNMVLVNTDFTFSGSLEMLVEILEFACCVLEKNRTSLYIEIEIHFKSLKIQNRAVRSTSQRISY